ncbi:MULTISPECIES: DUF5946 family protein [unclassified Kitasatospora]|uniref:DUF5946 family protein n=1 Tax=unclassified Kitasatospora TaxID=2633591 RepID=UPI002475A3F6|nr:DUF5946 family protein [Kitasatospora sp. MAP12-44]
MPASGCQPPQTRTQTWTHQHRCQPDDATRASGRGPPGGAALTYTCLQRRGNSHRVKGRPSRVVRDAALPLRDAPRSRFSVTIEDVAIDGTFPSSEFAERVKVWAAATVDAWSRGT